MKQIIVESCADCPHRWHDIGKEGMYCSETSETIENILQIRSDCPLDDLPEQITNEQFEKELERRISILMLEYEDTPRLTKKLFENLDFIKQRLLKGGKG